MSINEFEILLQKAQLGDREVQGEIFRMYRPLIIKNSMIGRMFDKDLYQELSVTLLNCIRVFKL